MAEATIAIAGGADAPAWARLRTALWPGAAVEHGAAIAAMLAGPDPARLALLAHTADGAVGLAEAALRHDYVNGNDTSPVAFLEGLYVVPAWRRRGLARRLVERVAGWGRARGCREFASDTGIANRAGRRLHAALGFSETERVVFFRRAIGA